MTPKRKQPQEWFPTFIPPTGMGRGATVILFFTCAYLALAFTWAFADKNQEFLLYLFLTPFVILFILMLHARIRFTLSMLWCLSLLGLLHVAGGLIGLPRRVPTEGPRLLYNWWLIEDKLKYDHLVHLFGSGVITAFCWQALQRTVASAKGWAYEELRPTVELLLFCVLAGMGLGSFNEILEFFATQFVRNHNVGGYVNTAMDMVSNSVGSVVVAGFIWYYGWRNRHRLG